MLRFDIIQSITKGALAYEDGMDGRISRCGGSIDPLLQYLRRCADVDGTFKIKTIDMEDLRDDVVVESVGPEVMLRNAPEAKKNSFVVPRIME